MEKSTYGAMDMFSVTVIEPIGKYAVRAHYGKCLMAVADTYKDALKKQKKFTKKGMPTDIYEPNKTTPITLSCP